MGVKNRVKKLESRAKNNSPTIVIVEPGETEEEASRRHSNKTRQTVTGRLLFVTVRPEL